MNILDILKTFLDFSIFNSYNITHAILLPGRLYKTKVNVHLVFDKVNSYVSYYRNINMSLIEDSCHNTQLLYKYN